MFSNLSRRWEPSFFIFSHNWSFHLVKANFFFFSNCFLFEVLKFFFLFTGQGVVQPNLEDFTYLPLFFFFFFRVPPWSFPYRRVLDVSFIVFFYCFFPPQRTEFLCGGALSIPSSFLVFFFLGWSQLGPGHISTPNLPPRLSPFPPPFSSSQCLAGGMAVVFLFGVTFYKSFALCGQKL